VLVVRGRLLGALLAVVVPITAPIAARADDVEPVASATETTEEVAHDTATLADLDAPLETHGHVTDAEASASGEVLFAWDPRWGRSGVPNYVLIGAGAAIAGVTIAIGTGGTNSPTRGGWLFDEEARGGLRLDLESDRLLARDISDVFLTVMTSAPTLLDGMILAAWQHHAPDIAFELVFIHAEVAAVTLALQVTANVLVTRERPYGRTCGGGGPDDLPEDSFMCNSPERNYSFFSGHTSQAFASAAVICSAHMNLPLLGGGPIELAPCFSGMAIAAATGLLRINGDQHYVTDVVLGAAIGTTVGFVLPWALHYRHRAPDAPSLTAAEVAEEEADGVEPIAAAPTNMFALLPTGNGLTVLGSF
jgi:membrane-associated phospholipid phosphatase